MAKKKLLILKFQQVSKLCENEFTMNKSVELRNFIFQEKPCNYSIGLFRNTEELVLEKSERNDFL